MIRLDTVNVLFGGMLGFIMNVLTIVARQHAFLYLHSLLLLYYFLLIHRLFCLYAPWCFGEYCNEQCVEHKRLRACS